MLEFYILGGIGALAAAGIGSMAFRAVWRNGLRAKAKGAAGEFKIRRILNSFSSKGGRSRHDILLPSVRGSTQIDHILVTRQGLFVIETKNYAGTVKGGKDDRMWRQYLSNGTKPPREFLNPILQNKSHVRAVRDLLGEYPQALIYSFVVFSERGKFPNLPGVIGASQLKPIIKLMTKAEPCLTAAQVREIEKVLDRNQIRGSDARAQHDFKANLAATASRDVDLDELVEKSNHLPPLLTPQQTSMTASAPEDPHKRMLTDTCATLKICGRTDTIDRFFESAKRSRTGIPVPPQGDFDFFVCPFTRDKFPKSEALNLYHGLWVTYLKQNPELVNYMKENSGKAFGNTMRCQKTLALYNADPAGFAASVRETVWYQNIVQKFQQKQRKPSLNEQIQQAEGKTPAAKPRGFEPGSRAER